MQFISDLSQCTKINYRLSDCFYCVFSISSRANLCILHLLDDLDNFLLQPKLITAAGYPSEKHRVLTEDGYSLQMHRIPAGRRTARRSEPSAKGKKAVLVMHGLLGSSGDFVIMGPGRSLCKDNLCFMWADIIYNNTHNINTVRTLNQRIVCMNGAPTAYLSLSTNHKESQIQQA